MWQYTNDILPWWVLYNTKVLFSVCRDDKQEKGKNKEVLFCKVFNSYYYDYLLVIQHNTLAHS